MEKTLWKMIKKYGLIVIAVFILSLFFTDFLFVSPIKEAEIGSFQAASTEVPDRSDIPRISEIEGPMIDSGAASIEATVSVSETCAVPSVAKICKNLPTKVWISLLFAYFALLIFNLTYEFGKKTKPQWFWESLYTLIFILGWFYFDQCGESVWFPLYILKIGIIIYFIYLYFFEKRSSLEK